MMAVIAVAKAVPDAYIFFLKTVQLSPLELELMPISAAACPSRFDLSVLTGVVGPVETAPEIVAKLNLQINKMLASKQLIDKLTALAAEAPCVNVTASVHADFYAPGNWLHKVHRFKQA